MEDKRTILVAILASALISGTVSFGLGAYFRQTHITYLSNLGVDFETLSIHARVTMWQNGKLVFSYEHPGVVTNIGDNMTLAWLFGDSDYNVSSYAANITYISIGNQGALSTASTQLPAEWNRTSATIEDEGQSTLNLTCTFLPDAGPYTADCIGLNWESAGDESLWAYDTFTEVSGIDDTFTINVEFQVSVSHS